MDGTAIQVGTPEEQLRNLRALQISAGGLTSPRLKGTIWEGYTLAINPTRKWADPWCNVLRNGFPTSDRLVNRERGRMFAALEDPDAAPQRIRFRPELVVRASTGG